MKKRVLLGLILACVLCLTACGAQSKSSVWTEENAQTILSSGAFSETLEEVDADTAFALYQLSGQSLNRDALTGCFVRRSAGATCEELAFLQFSEQAQAASAKDALDAYVQNQIAANQDYRPSEIPKLESAWVEQRGNTLLLVVANDLNLAKEAVT
jgi:hypothetical protein